MENSHCKEFFFIFCLSTVKWKVTSGTCLSFTMKPGNKANLFVFLTRDLVALTTNELAKWLQPGARRELIVCSCLANKATVSLAM